MSFDLVIENLVKKAELAIPTEDIDYIGEDGRLYCGNCHTPKQSRVMWNGVEIMPKCLCKCKAEERDRLEAERKLREKVELYRRDGFPEREMLTWTFTNDDGVNERVTNALKRYVDNFSELYIKSTGLLLYGNVGTGKTFGACEIANALIDKGVPVLVTNFASLAKAIEKNKYNGNVDVIESLNRYKLIVIDDLGTERQSEYMQEIVFNIIDSRYRSGKPFIVTTNLSMEEMKTPKDIGNSRIYDRVLERCFPIEFTGGSKRRKAVREGYDDTKDLLGL